MSRGKPSGLSLVVGVDKPAGMSSHDVVNACRRIFGERRVGHTGTLDPAATGALAVCVGPAARLDRFLTGHRKTYEFSIVFSTATDTDDAEGQVVGQLPVPDQAFDPSFAQRHVAVLVGPARQTPPLFSAIKVSGVRAYDAARKGTVVHLEPRDIHIYEAELLGVDEGADGGVVWRVRASVSAGTYVRAIARDVGLSLGSCAHVGYLRRTRAGWLDVSECASIEAIAENPFSYVVDPVRLLQARILFADPSQARDVANGKPLGAHSLALHAYDTDRDLDRELCGCTNGLHVADAPLAPDELVSVVAENRLQAVYRYDAQKGQLVSACGFATGVRRGADI